MGKIALMFPGQGSQYEQMGLDFLEKNKQYKKYFDMCTQQMGEEAVGILREGEKLGNTRYSQPLIYTLSSAVCDYLDDTSSIRLKASAVVGHSLGEYTALYGAGAYSFAQGLELVDFRAKIMAEENRAANGMMAAVLSRNIGKIKDIVQKNNAYIANYNDYSQYVISGQKRNVKSAIKELKANGIRKVIPLKVNIASHCPLMEGVAGRLANYLLKNVKIKGTEIPFYSSTKGKFVDKEDIKAALTQQLVMPIKWLDTVLFLLQSGYEVFIEIGPKTVLANLVKRISRHAGKKARVFNTDSVDDIKILQNYLEGENNPNET